MLHKSTGTLQVNNDEALGRWSNEEVAFFWFWLDFAAESFPINSFTMVTMLLVETRSPRPILRKIWVTPF